MPEDGHGGARRPDGRAGDGDAKRRDDEGMGADTRQAMASARTLQSDSGLDSLVSADTMLADRLAPDASSSSPRLPREGGEVLGNRYEILAELGRGGEGVVYRARDLKADAIVALKLLQQQHDTGSELRLKRFRRELRMARKVTHPNVVRIHDLVELPGRFGLSMELVDGQPLDARLDKGPLGRDEVVTLAVDLARALAAAHAAGVTHRDLKPANVLLRASDGRAMVTDFGVSRAQEAVEEVKLSAAKDATPLKLTREGAIIGTPQYMAPEQLEGRVDIGPPADVYAFGMVVREAATGQRLHECETLGELKRLRNAEPAPPLREARPDLPRRLCDAVDRALERDAKARFPSGGELLAAIEPALTGGGRRPPVWAIATLLAVTAGGAVVWARRPAPIIVNHAAAPAAKGPTTPPLALHAADAHRITFGDACEEFPTFTPDGKTVLYDGTVGRDSFIYALDVSGNGPPRKLTDVRGWDIAPSVSPNGERMAFVRFEGERIGAYVAPLDGSSPPRLVTRGSVRPSWSRDGKAIWAGSGAPIGEYDVESGALLRTLEGAPPARTAETAELPDGSVLAALQVREAADANVGGVVLFPPAGPPRWLFQGDIDEVLAVAPDARHALVARENEAAAIELTDVPLDGSPPASLRESGVTARKGLAFSPGGEHLAWSTCQEVPQVIAFDAAGRPHSALLTDVPDATSLVAVPGTRQIALVSTRTATAEPWIVTPSSDELPRHVPVGALSVRQIAVGPDGNRFVVTVAGEGIYAGSLAERRTPLHRLTNNALDSVPAFRAGGRQITFTRHPTDALPRIMVVPFGGGEVGPLLEEGSDFAAPSPVDDRVAYLAGTSSAELVPTVWDGHAGRRPLSKQLPAGRYADLRFSPDGRRVALARGDTEIVEVDVATGAIVRTLWTPTGDQLQDPTYTPAGLMALRVRWQGNIWLADASIGR